MARSSRTTVRTTPTIDPVAALAAQVAALTELVASMTATPEGARAIVVAQESKQGGKRRPKATPKKAPKVYSWKPWACAKFGIPAIEGASFAYNGKNGTTDHVVTKVDTDGTVHSVRA